jgi:glycogen debranching enzyme
VLAILAGLADETMGHRIVKTVSAAGASDPYPIRVVLHPLTRQHELWRPYMARHQQNRVHQYHNGGIWPFVGGMWVRFIHRLGFQDVACRELVRLAQLNQLGRDQEWEFTEWAHGQTGRPMGKAYQAWSAASFIRACQEVGMDPVHLTD